MPPTLQWTPSLCHFGWTDCGVGCELSRFAELRDELGAIGAEALVHTIANYDDLKATPTTQHTLSEAPSLAQKIDKSVGKVRHSNLLSTVAPPLPPLPVD